MESTVQIPEIVLNSGHKMPVVGFGCAAIPNPPPEKVTAILLEAMKIGYRHFDTAACYGTEDALGRAVSQAIEGGLVKGREEFFITSKLWCTDAERDLVLPALKKTLGKLGLDYVDLYLVHWPIRMRQEVADNFNPAKEDLLPLDVHGTWTAMEECGKLGLAKSIGVSNFSYEKLSKLLQQATIHPAVNQRLSIFQVEMNVAWQQRKLLPFCKQKRIHLSAWSPLGGSDSFWGSNRVIENQVLKDIAASKSKTLAQVALRWVYEQGASILVRSFNRERMMQNLQIFHWELTKEEMDQIQQIPQRRGYFGDLLIHPEGPIKSVEEFWDGDF